MTYSEAARLALQQEMARDARVWALGEDLGSIGGSAGQYRGLQEEFGGERILDTPSSESTLVGAAVGAAMCGTRPVVELRSTDVGLCATEEIVNQAAKIRYMFNGQARVPVVIRHGQSMEAWWVHVPGLVVVAPATPADNHGLLKAAIRCDDPVVYLEHKELWNIRGEVDPEREALLGRAQRLSDGKDLTIVTWSKMRHVCVSAAQQLLEQGVGAEVIDLRTLWPWDHEMVLQSVRSTGRLLVVHEAVRVAGFGAEIAAEVGEALWRELKGPVRRLGGPRSPVPYAEPLENVFRISPQQVAKAAMEMIREWR
jgi:pyruvate dehydrogenase E1 component beta subunit